jgi:uncharacterized protein
MQTYKTPGIYVEEIPVFPPSVAEVETAIPAFIGYTEKAGTDNKERMKPVIIRDYMQYVEVFGVGPKRTATVSLDAALAITNVDLQHSDYFTHDSVRLFYLNGGGKCYVVSVGGYDASIDSAKIIEGIDAIMREDEPTLILMPDAVSVIGDADRIGLHKTVLGYCQKLGDRFLIADLKDPAPDTKIIDSVNTYRSNIGINDLKYGAVYVPWLKTTLPVNIGLDSIIVKNQATQDEIPWEKLTTDSALQSYITNNITQIKNEINNLNNLNVAYQTNGTVPTGSLYQQFSKKTKEFKSEIENNSAVIMDKAKDTFQFLIKVLHDYFNVFYKGIRPPSSTDAKDPYTLQTDIKRLIIVVGIAKSFVEQIVKPLNGDILAAGTNKTIMLNLLPDYTTNTTGFLQIIQSQINTISGATSVNLTASITYTGDIQAKFKQALSAAESFFTTSLLPLIEKSLTLAQSYQNNFNAGLADRLGKYKEILAAINDVASIIPPSGAVAGIYAKVDSERGVWKAPANVSLNGVVGPTIKITDAEQEELNVDVNAGKSINCIRAFTGKGTLIWGARTLAGNDNEWRYIPVRRFFNMVEESVKKSTSWAVFEPNDANLWVRVKAMIENYLTQKWREGALQGAVPQDAFKVNVGLGKTMTAVDIQEGKLIIEIGMAVVRPAEFIIMKFMHQMARS